VVYTATAVTGATEEYNGSTWTTSPASLSTARGGFAGTGTLTSALGFGGSPVTGATEEFTRCRSSSNKNNYSKLTGGKYGTYKNIHRS
jgi:hypothetical protein